MAPAGTHAPLYASRIIGTAFKQVESYTLTFRHEPSLTLIRLHRPRLEPSRQAKVADFQLAIGVNEQVSRFEITVEDIGRVDVLGVSWVGGGIGGGKRFGE